MYLTTPHEWFGESDIRDTDATDRLFTADGVMYNLDGAGTDCHGGRVPGVLSTAPWRLPDTS
jgi:hypothetical protein